VPAGEQIRPLGTFAGRRDEPVEQDRAQPGPPHRLNGDRGHGLPQQRPDPAEYPPERRLGTPEQLTRDI